MVEKCTRSKVKTRSPLLGLPSTTPANPPGITLSLSSSSFLPFGGQSARKKASSTALSVGSGTPSSPPSLFAPPIPPSAATFRDLVFRGSVSLQVTINEADLPPNADRTAETLFVRLQSSEIPGVGRN